MDTKSIINIIIIFICIHIISKLISNYLRKKSSKKGAKKIYETQKEIYSKRHEYQEINPNVFTFLDLSFYDKIRDLLLSERFKFMGDYENMTLSKIAPNMRTFIRTMLDPSGTIMTGIYHFKARGWIKFILMFTKIPSQNKTIDFESELDNGTFICTSNTLKMDTTGDVPGIVRNQFPSNIPVLEMLNNHKNSIQNILSQSSGVKLLKMNSLAEILSSQQRLQDLKNKHKQSFGYMDKTELEKISQNSYKEATDDVIKEIDKIKQGRDND